MKTLSQINPCFVPMGGYWSAASGNDAGAVAASPVVEPPAAVVELPAAVVELPTAAATVQSGAEDKLVYRCPFEIPAKYKTVFQDALLRLTLCHDIVIAGGSVMALANPRISADLGIHDVDIFVLGARGVEVIWRELLSQPDTKFCTIDPRSSGLLVVVNPRFSSAPMQIMFGMMGCTLQTLLQDFDFDVVAASVRLSRVGSPPMLVTLEGTDAAWAHQVATIQNPAKCNARRVLNTRKKGFTVQFTGSESFRGLIKAIGAHLPAEYQMSQVGKDMMDNSYVTLGTVDKYWVADAILFSTETGVTRGYSWCSVDNIKLRGEVRRAFLAGDFDPVAVALRSSGAGAGAASGDVAGGASVSSA